MHNDDIIELIQSQLPMSKVIIGGDGYHFQLTVIDNLFLNKSKVQRQQLVYKALSGAISSGALHAVSLQVFTEEEYVDHKAGTKT